MSFVMAVKSVSSMIMVIFSLCTECVHVRRKILTVCNHIITQNATLFSLVSTERTETVEGEDEPKKTELKHDKYFGEEVLGPGENTYSATVTSLSNTTCWKIDKMTVKRTLGKLRMKRRASGTVA